MSVTCTYCEKVNTTSAENCTGCGAPLPKREIPRAKTNYNSTILMIIGAISFVIVIIAVASFFAFLADENQPTIGDNFTTYMIEEEYEEFVEDEEDVAVISLQMPADVITDSALRQALEFFFRREIGQISWEDLQQIKTVVIDSESILMSFENVALSDLPESSAVVNIITDASVENLDQLGYFGNLNILALRTPQMISASTLEQLLYLEELEYRAHRNLTDLTSLANLSQLMRLTITGGSFTSLQGLSELTNLYALSFKSTGLADLSLLNQQQNITELTLYRNNDLASINTLESMTWLRSLHIERMDEVNLHVISNLTNLEELTVIRTDVRSYDFILPLVNLRYLRLFNNRDVPEIPSLSVLTGLEELHIDNVRNSGQARSTDFLNNIPSLRVLTLDDHDSLEPLRNMPHLEELHLSFGWHLADASPLGDLTNLQSLRIFESQPTEIHNMDAIGDLTQLTSLDLSGNSVGQFTMFFEWDFVYALTNLEYLDISDNTVVGDFTGIGNLQQLSTLNMSNVRLIPYFNVTRDGGFVNIYFGDRMDIEDYSSSLGMLTNLEVLDISSNLISDINFASDLESLQFFYAEDNYIADVSPLSELSNLVFADLRRNAITNWNVLDDLIDTYFLGR